MYPTGDDTQHAFESLALSLGMGLLVGFQRERAGSRIAGVRTFPLITILGTVAALLAPRLGEWIVPAALLGLVITVATANFLALRQDGTRGAGLTTEVSILLMFLVGAYAAVGSPTVVLVIGGGTALLLYLKGGLHGLATEKIGDRDMQAIMVFVAIAFVVYPVLPDAPYGPMGVWNPRKIWLVVVLVVGIALGGYVAYKVFGDRAGTVLAGILGGMISSTAQTFGYARQSARAPKGVVDTAMVVIVIATAMTYPRMSVEVAATAPTFAGAALPPLLVMTVVGTLTALVVWLMCRSDAIGPQQHENPTQLRSALVFAAIYALVLLASAAGQRYLGAGGAYAVAAVAGATNLDAITLSDAQLATLGKLDSSLAWRAIFVASISNLVFKLLVVAVLGNRRLLALVGGAFAVHIAAALLIMACWRAEWRFPI